MKEEQIPTLVKSAKEIARDGIIIGNLFRAKTDRDKPMPEFNGKTYVQWYKDNEEVANTVIARDKTNVDLAIKTGTVEQKMIVVLSEINRLNLSGEVRAFDKESQELQSFGAALTDICEKTAEIEKDEEKKLMRQLELLKQGTVFVQDNWVKRWKKTKVMSKTFTGSIDDISWEEKFECIFDGPERSLLYGPGVYLGNIREFEMSKQPFIFTVKQSSYQEVESRYGQKNKEGKDIWERWKYVSKKKITMVNELNLSAMQATGGAWALGDIENDRVEEIHYMDYLNDEYQIYLNGTPMLPAEFPLSAITPGGMFNVEKQVLQVINPFFTYGRSFIAKTEQLAALLDEMIRLLIIKTRKSIHPPYANIGGKVISQKSLMPGVISMGIDPNALVPIGQEGQGATASEYQMLAILKTEIDNVTVSPQMQGQQGKTGQTAYEIDVLKQQAQKSLSLMIFAASMLEKKVTQLRNNYILANYFNPIDTKVDEARQAIKDIYRTVSRTTTLKGQGSGTRKTIITDNTTGITPESVFNEEQYSGTPVPTTGRRMTRTELGMEPLQIFYLSAEVLKKNVYTFFIEVIAKPKDNSTNAKLMFREELRDLQALQQMGSSLNIEEIQNEYATIWNKRKEKMFSRPQVMPPNMQEAMSGGSPKVLNENIPKVMPQMMAE